MVADPFEVEHNTTGQISSRNLERMNKTWKRILLRSKMKKFTGKINFIIMVSETNSESSMDIHFGESNGIYFKTLIKTTLMH